MVEFAAVQAALMDAKSEKLALADEKDRAELGARRTLPRPSPAREPARPPAAAKSPAAAKLPDAAIRKVCSC